MTTMMMVLVAVVVLMFPSVSQSAPAATSPELRGARGRPTITQTILRRIMTTVGHLTIFICIHIHIHAYNR